MSCLFGFSLAVANSYEVGVEMGVSEGVTAFSGVVATVLGGVVVMTGSRVLGRQVVTRGWSVVCLVEGNALGRGVFLNGPRVLGKLGRLSDGRVFVGVEVAAVVG